MPAKGRWNLTRSLKG